MKTRGKETDVGSTDLLWKKRACSDIALFPHFGLWGMKK